MGPTCQTLLPAPRSRCLLRLSSPSKIDGLCRRLLHPSAPLSPSAVPSGHPSRSLRPCATGPFPRHHSITSVRLPFPFLTSSPPIENPCPTPSPNCQPSSRREGQECVRRPYYDSVHEHLMLPAALSRKLVALSHPRRRHRAPGSWPPTALTDERERGEREEVDLGSSHAGAAPPNEGSSSLEIWWSAAAACRDGSDRKQHRSAEGKIVERGYPRVETDRLL